jgi:hypothetical protein
LFLEIRKEEPRLVTFSALDLADERLLWHDISFDEKWWVTLSDVAENILLFTVFTDTNNPDRKSVLAYDYERSTIQWWRNNFSLSAVTANTVTGTDTLVSRVVTIDLLSGQDVKEQPVLPMVRNFSVLKPLHYYQDAPHFETVQSFLRSKCGISAVSLIEYLEYGSRIVMSFYVEEPDLANFLIVLNDDGEILFKEKIGEHLQGLGVDTFFIFSGYLIFVKNKSGLASYKFV